ncbi:MAG TPA: enoyl-CoA hydratase-related protein [Eoetvoesiella sp.]
MNFNNISVVVEDGVAVVLMDRPPVNAMSAKFRRDLTDVFAELGNNPEVRAIVISGANNVFCGGMDIKEKGDPVRARSDAEHRAFTNGLRECPIPIVAALNGATVGTGVNIAAACDVIVASENAFMAMPEVSVGIPNGASGLVRLFGQSRGRRMFFTGMRVSAAELYRLGVVEACVPADQLMSKALQIAHEIAKQDPLVLAAAKHIYNLAQEVPFGIAKNMEYAMAAQLSAVRMSGGALTSKGGV